MARAILTDIEGTTSSIAFVKEVLFPYAAQHLPAFVHRHAHEPVVATQVEAVRQLAGEPQASLSRVVAILLQWIAEDRKATPLKTLQGLVWEHGYASGAYRAHAYADAVTRLREWHAQGIALYVYSSGSVAAQKLFFAHSEAGDLTPLFSGYFDTTTGAKQSADAYRSIARAIGQVPADILFLSDIPAELDAAREAGLQTCWILRPQDHTGLAASGEAHPHAHSFLEVTP